MVNHIYPRDNNNEIDDSRTKYKTNHSSSQEYTPMARILQTYLEENAITFHPTKYSFEEKKKNNNFHK